ncbi:F-box protein SKIP19-like [Rosa sericea]
MSSPSSPKRPCGAPIRNWTELPEDVTAAILSRLGAIDILETAQKVCKTWYKVCKDPLMWRIVDFRDDDLPKVHDLGKMCRYAVDRSDGKLVSINLDSFATDELLKYITDSSSGIRCLRLVRCDITSEGLSAVSSRLTLLEELEISHCSVSHETLEVVGASCPLLKSLKLNSRWYSFAHEECNKHALAIAGTMHNLHHLQIFANKLTNDGLQAILDGCPPLESLDLRQCYNLNLEEDLEKRLVERIKLLRLPDDSTDDYEFDATVLEYGSDNSEPEVEFFDEMFMVDDADGEVFPWNGFVEFEDFYYFL